MLLTVMLLAVAMNAHALNVDQVMTASFDSSAGAIKVQWAKNDAEIISALTNTVQTVFDVKHTTTGVPANGIEWHNRNRRADDLSQRGSEIESVYADCR